MYIHYNKPNWRSSRIYQNLLHITGAFYQISLVLMGMFFGKDEGYLGITFGIISFISSRLSSELQYKVQQALIEERHKRA